MIRAATFVFLLVAVSHAYAQPQDAELLEEHVFGGPPSDGALLVRTGYVLAWDAETRVPLWVAYHIVPDYRSTPPRDGTFKSYRNDPDLADPVTNADYIGLKAARGYARGHMAPYAVMGGDRDGDGQLAEDGDLEDSLTVVQSNYMSNVAPQHHNGFNGAGGLWFELERWVQDDLLAAEGELWVFAGTVFGTGPHEAVGPDETIGVPPLFYKIVIFQEQSLDHPMVLAFLFPHQRISHGEIEDFLVSVDVIEALTGLDFFSALDLDEEELALLEDTDTWLNWLAIQEE